jgi:hypothetical protein
MASTPPDVNIHVKIGDLAYEIRDAGTDRYGVYDEFGGHLGYFEMRGKRIVADDFGRAGAPPVVDVARAWVAAVGPVQEKKSFHLCRIARVNDADELTVRRAKAYATWLKSCGAKAAFVSYDEESKKLTLFSVWGAQTRMANALEKEAPADAGEPSSAEVEILSLAQDF